MQPNEELSAMIIMPVFFAACIWVVKIWLDWKKHRLKNDLQNKLVEKIGNIQDLNNFLQTESGDRFLNSLTVAGGSARDKLLSAFSSGIILAVLGVSYFAIALFFETEARYINAGGIVILALGIGFLISALVSYRMSKKWGIIENGNGMLKD
jgi:hypothetical protein